MFPKRPVQAHHSDLSECETCVYESRSQKKATRLALASNLDATEVD